MKVIGYESSGPLARKTREQYDKKVEYTSDISCEAKVNVHTAFFDWEGVRPVLVLLGEVEAVAGDLPCGMSEVSFSREYARPQVRYRCGFTDNELAELCRKGLFADGRYGLACPELFKASEFYLPVKCDCEFLPAEAVPAYDTEYQSMAPLLFLTVKDQFCIELTSEQNPYDLVTYYPERSEQKKLESEFGANVIRFEQEETLTFEAETPETKPEIKRKDPEEEEVKEPVAVQPTGSVDDGLSPTERMFQAALEKAKARYEAFQSDIEANKEQHEKQAAAIEQPPEPLAGDELPPSEVTAESETPTDPAPFDQHDPLPTDPDEGLEHMDGVIRFDDGEDKEMD